MTKEMTSIVWEAKFEAEVRSLYFAHMASRYTKYKNWIAAATFLLSSTAVGTLVADIDKAWPIGLSLVVAVLGAVSIALGLDRSTPKMASLHASWNALADEYEKLWNHWYEDDAEQTLERLKFRAREISTAAVNETPWRPKILKRWEQVVRDRYATSAA